MKIISELKQTNWAILAAFAFCLAASVYPSLNTIGLYAVAPCIIAFAFIKHGKTIFSNGLIKRYFLMWAWIGISVLTATVSTKAAFDEFIPITASMLLSISLYSICNKWGNIKWMYIIYILYFFELLFYAYTNIGTQLDFASTDRGGGADVKMNSNNFAYYLFFATVCVILLLERLKAKTKVVFIASLVLLFFLVFIALFTASRQVLIIGIPLLGIWLALKYFKNISGIFAFIIIIALLVYFVPIVFDKYIAGSYLAVRAELNVGEDERTILLKSALAVGLEHPITGVGPANFVYYNYFGGFSHCSYAELFACSGVIPAFLFISILFVFLKNCIRRYRKTNLKIFQFLFLCGLFYAFYNIFYVFYNVPWLMMFLFILIGHSDYEYRQYQLQRCR